MLATVPILAGWLFTVACCYAAGLLLLRFASVELFVEEAHFFRFVTGSACISLAVFTLSAAHLAYAAVFLAAGTVLLLFCLRRPPPSAPMAALPDYPNSWKAIFWVALLGFGTYYFIYALAPEMSPDGATYHLGLVSRYLRQHSFGHITTSMYANLSEGIEMLFLVAFSLGRHSAAALIEFTFLCALPWGMLSYARRYGFPQAGVFGALLVYASPVFGLSGSIAYNDAAGACILFAVFYLLQIWVETRQSRLIPLIGLLAGFCYGAKYTLFLALPYAAGVLLVHLWRARQPWLRPLLVYSACALLTVAPWMAKNWLTVRNPFSPFANRLFPNPYITVHFEREYSDIMQHREGLTLAQRPLEHILKGNRTAGLLGPVFLLAPLALLALRFRAGRNLMFAAALFLLPAYTNVETRFLMPMAPFLSLALGLVLSQVPVAAALVLAFHLLASWPSNIHAYAAPYAWVLNDFHPAEAFRLVPEPLVLRRRMPAYEVAELLERLTPPEARIFSFGNPPEAYTSREILVKYESALGNRIGQMLWTPLLQDLQPKVALVFDFTTRLVQRLRVVQTAAHPSELWNVNELRVFRGQIEIPRDAAWRLSASVNPWEVALAFDNNPVTSWSTMEPLRPGMTLTADLGRLTELSSVELDAPSEWAPRLELQLQREAGEWIALAAPPQSHSRQVEAGLRASATAELKAMGVGYLLISGDDFGKDDFFLLQQEWQIQLLGEAQGSRLYKLL